MTRADARPRTTSTSTHSEIHLALELEGESDSALLRVVSTLHRRRCRVLQAAFSDSPGTGGRLDLRIHAPAAYAPRVEHWLRGLIDVRRAVTLPSD